MRPNATITDKRTDTSSTYSLGKVQVELGGQVDNLQLHDVLLQTPQGSINGNCASEVVERRIEGEVKSSKIAS